MEKLLRLRVEILKCLVEDFVIDSIIAELDAINMYEQMAVLANV